MKCPHCNKTIKPFKMKIEIVPEYVSMIERDGSYWILHRTDSLPRARVNGNTARLPAAPLVVELFHLEKRS